jgi:DNA-binding NarL/FixJ family response regulator
MQNEPNKEEKTMTMNATVHQLPISRQHAKLRPRLVLSAGERKHFAELRERLKPALQAIVDIEAGVRGLTAREEKILNLVLDGQTNRAICEAVGAEEVTVKAHLFHIYTKFGVSSRSELAATVFGRR